MTIALRLCIAATMLGTNGPAMAHDDGFSQQFSAPRACLEPLKPIVSSFVERGQEAELRREFELYFRDVETYLNCLNRETHRVMAEAERAAYELNHIFDRFPDSIDNAPAIVERPPMVNSGHLNLDYTGVGG
ncbi:hypothetical protein [Parasulfitobacter algicola]|uniref:Uncharacterized protein n=1 Tax=Parasulfitobacter algicola TaxID=2614809 RepID=A0ABX2J0X9_9RHOB|nr:hypothetical protein [Sulfitobacter algicola]NSX56886.1 hypothetical protein [Sulfitobacter algicola]